MPEAKVFRSFLEKGIHFYFSFVNCLKRSLQIAYMETSCRLFLHPANVRVVTDTIAKITELS